MYAEGRNLQVGPEGGTWDLGPTWSQGHLRTLCVRQSAGNGKGYACSWGSGRFSTSGKVWKRLYARIARSFQIAKEVTRHAVTARHT